MKSKLVRLECGEVRPDKLLCKILFQCGRYYQPGMFFYQRLWREHLRHLGFVVISVEKLDCHHLWEIKLRGTLTAQAYLLLSKPVSPKSLKSEDIMAQQLKAEIRQLASEIGAPIKRDEISVTRTGGHVRIGFLWPLGNSGLLMRKEKRPDAFPYLMRPWLRSTRN